ncbi:hypothetical protein ANN_11341 [Periplaneta americana]|uniref:Uncharacterized protein n=1 Tax=Periplaneta americana TaxID=6978 RepID=A0ABQ8T5W3_PERAM|nr:hypothetical protein ANN_11341 [Periplaneta americana]
MVGLCEDGNEPPGSLKAVRTKSLIEQSVKPLLREKVTDRHTGTVRSVMLSPAARDFTYERASLVYRALEGVASLLAYLLTFLTVVVVVDNLFPAREVRRRFQERFSGVDAPDSKTVHNLYHKFQETGTVQPKKPKKQRRVLTEEILHDIRNHLENSPRKSLRRHAQQFEFHMGLCKRLPTKVLHYRLQMLPPTMLTTWSRSPTTVHNPRNIKIELVQSLKDRDRWRGNVRVAMNLRVPQKPFVIEPSMKLSRQTRWAADPELRSGLGWIPLWTLVSSRFSPAVGLKLPDGLWRVLGINPFDFIT